MPPEDPGAGGHVKLFVTRIPGTAIRLPEERYNGGRDVVPDQKRTIRPLPPVLSKAKHDES